MYFVWLFLIITNLFTFNVLKFNKNNYQNNLKNFFSNISRQSLTSKIIILDFLKEDSNTNLFFVLNNENINIYSLFFKSGLFVLDTKKSFLEKNIKFFKKTEKNLFNFFKKINFMYFYYKLNEKKFLKLNFFFSLNFSFFKKILKLRFLNFNNFVYGLNKSNFLVYYLRKNKIFNKSRYSRNRQIYRTGVYWCLWVNIIFVYGLYYYFYRFSFNFGYLWIGLFLFIVSFFFSRLLQFNLFSVNNVMNEIVFFKNWCFLLINNIGANFKKFFN